MLLVVVTQIVTLQQSVSGSWQEMFVWTHSPKVQLYRMHSAFRDIQSLGLMTLEEDLVFTNEFTAHYSVSKKLIQEK